MYRKLPVDIVNVSVREHAHGQAPLRTLHQVKQSRGALYPHVARVVLEHLELAGDV